MMKSEDSGIFRKEAVETMSSPEQLDRYVQVTRPGIWLVLGLVVVLVGLLVVWSIVGSVPTTVKFLGIADDETVTCYLSESQVKDISAGAPVAVEGGSGFVASIASVPLSPREVADAVPNDYDRSQLSLGDWSYPVIVSVDRSYPTGAVVSVVVTQNETSPISFLFS